MARILIIDDEAAMRAVLRESLERVGHEVVEAVDGETGLLCFKENPAELVITDIFMPGKDGFATVEAFREEYRDVKILVVSGAGGLDDPGHYLNLAKRMGADGTLSKPVQLDTLLESVEALLSAK